MKNSVKEGAPFPHPLYTLYMFMLVYFIFFLSLVASILNWLGYFFRTLAERSVESFFIWRVKVTHIRI